MSKLLVPFFKEIGPIQDKMSAVFDHLTAHPISHVSWSQYPYLPKTAFKIAYTNQAILLNYEVEERYLRINSFQSNDPVYEDSCVEFFISFRDKYYYNLEFNAVGVGLIGYGTKDKDSRERLANSTIEKIKSYSSIERNLETKGVKWKLSLYIPLEIFEKEAISDLSGVEASANFYKCGDLLPEAHFVSWNPIEFPQPNFHLPEYFGQIKFE